MPIRKLGRLLFLTSVLIVVYGCYILYSGIGTEKPETLSLTLSAVGPTNAPKQHGNKNQTTTPRRPTSSAAVVSQIPNGILAMIEGIESRHEFLNGKVEPVHVEKPACGPTRTPINGVEDLLCMTPPTFLEIYKNPCWVSKRNVFKCLPYFQVIGIDKSGSTDLFDRIAKHPDVVLNNGTLGKETMWWSWRRYGHWLKYDLKVKETFHRYTRYFQKAASRILASNTSAGIITGDGTPMDLWDMSGWVSIPQNHPPDPPSFLTPHLIRHVNPNVKMLIILRDPVERLFSDYFFLGLGKMSAEGFHASLIRSLELLYGCTRRLSLKMCLFQREFHIKALARIHIGFYSVFLREWLKVFPREQFYIMETASYSDNMQNELENIFQFLHLRKLPETDITKIVQSSKKYVTKRKKKATMLPKSRVILERLYQRFNSELAVLLNDQKFTWNQNKSVKTS